MAPAVSVIIPTYNRAHCIGDAINSVLRQSFQDFEFIVVDDGSTDDTSDVLGTYGNRITLIRQANAGVSSARHTGVRAARGEWVAFLDSDDTWDTDKLKTQIEDVQKNPEAVAHIMDAAFTDPLRQCPSIFDLKCLKEEFTERPLRSRPLLDVLLCAFPTPCCLIRRTVIERAGYSNTSFRILEDLDLLARVALEGPFMVNCHVGATVRRRPGGALQLSDLYNSSKLENFRNWVVTLSRLESDSRLTPTERRYVRRKLSARRSQAAVECWKQGDVRASIAAHLASVVDDPGLRSAVRALLAASGTKKLVRRLFPLRCDEQR